MARNTPGQRRYYSQRARAGAQPRIDLPMLCRLLWSAYTSFVDKDYFQEAMGYYCVDAGDVNGFMGADIAAFFFRALRKDNLWPIGERHPYYSEDDAFDVIELLYDSISEPVGGAYHSYGNCGWHYSTFDKEGGQRAFRAEVNRVLSDYGPGYELSEDGEVLALAPEGLEDLFEDEPPAQDPKNVEDRVSLAVRKFRRHHASEDDRRDAVRDLADVLEFLRPTAKELLPSKDESDLFNIANSFGIRHHNPKQKTDYDQGLWLEWIFYAYLATVRLVLQLIAERSEEAVPDPWGEA